MNQLSAVISEGRHSNHITADYAIHFIGLLLMLLITTSSLPAKCVSVAEVDELNGLWIGTVETMGFAGEMELNLARAPGMPKAELRLSSAGQAFSDSAHDIKVSGNRISFSTGIEILGIKYRLTFNGQLSGNDLKGTLSAVLDDSSSASGTWLLKHQEKGSIEYNSRLELPSPTGPYQVGRRHFAWVDDRRQEVMTDDPADHRELVVQIWYPAEPPCSIAASPYFSNLEVLKGVYGDALISHVNLLSSHSVDEAKLAIRQPKYPVLIFSPVSGVSISFISSLRWE